MWNFSGITLTVASSNLSQWVQYHWFMLSCMLQSSCSSVVFLPNRLLALNTCRAVKADWSMVRICSSTRLLMNSTMGVSKSKPVR